MHPLLLFTLLFLPGIRAESNFFDKKMLWDPYPFGWSSKPVAFEEDHMSSDSDNGPCIVIPRTDNGGIHGSVQYYTTRIDEKGNTVPSGYVYKSFSYGSSNKPIIRKNKVMTTTSFELNNSLNSVSFDNHNKHTCSEKGIDKLKMKQDRYESNFDRKEEKPVITDKLKQKSSDKTTDFGNTETSLRRPFLMNEFDDRLRSSNVEPHTNINSRIREKLMENSRNANKENKWYSDKSEYSKRKMLDLRKKFFDNFKNDEFDFETIDPDFVDSDEMIKTDNKASLDFDRNKSIKKDLHSHTPTPPYPLSFDNEHHIHFGKKFMDVEMENEHEESKQNNKLDHFNVFSEYPFIQAEKTQNRGKETFMSMNADDTNAESPGKDHQLMDVKRNPSENEYKSHPVKKGINTHKSSEQNKNGALNIGLPRDTTTIIRFDEIQPLTTPRPPTLRPPQQNFIATPVMKKPTHSHHESTTAENLDHKGSISNDISQNNNQISNSSSNLADVINLIKKILGM